jgi:glycosyltransferase involved in cell wall biosynthesis
VVHTHLIHADLFGQLAARIASVPAISSVHGTHPFYRRRWPRLAARIAGRLARRTIAISEHVGRFILEMDLASPDRVRVVHYAIDVSGWQVADTDRVRARAQLHLAASDVAVGVASRLVPRKGHDFLIESLASATRDAPQLRLLIAGDGELRARLEPWARSRLDGSVRFLGHVDDVRGFMNACDIMVFPTLPGFGEGFGLAALEAMAAARPVLATDLDSLPEVVPDGEAGFLVPPGAVDELSSLIVYLATEPELRREMGARAREHARSTFPVEKMVERTLAVYREVA